MPPCRQRQFARSGTASTTAPVVILIANPTTALEPDATTNHARPPPTGQTDAIYTRLLPLVALFWLDLGAESGGNPHPSYRRLGFTVSPPDPDHHPVAAAVGWNWLLRYRRMLGLFAFFYALLHFAIYLVFDQFFDPAAIARDVLKRPYITVGFLAFVLLIPLAATSTNAMIRRLGARRWQRLHRLVDAIGLLVILHYLWLVKADLNGRWHIRPCWLCCWVTAYGSITAIS